MSGAMRSTIVYLLKHCCCYKRSAAGNRAHANSDGQDSHGEKISFQTIPVVDATCSNCSGSNSNSSNNGGDSNSSSSSCGSGSICGGKSELKLTRKTAMRDYYRETTLGRRSECVRSSRVQRQRLTSHQYTPPTALSGTYTSP